MSAPSQTGVNPTQFPINIGQRDPIVNTVVDPNGNTRPTGTVTCDDGGAGGTFTNNPCTLRSIPGNPFASNCTVTYTAPTTGQIVNIHGAYSGDAIFAPSSGNASLPVIGRIINLFRRLHP